MKRVLLRVGMALAILTVVGMAAWAAGTQAAAVKEEPVVITWHGSRGLPGPNAPIPALVEEMVSEKLGYPVQFNLVGTADSNHTPQLQMMLAANDIPDCYLYMGLDDEFLSQAAAAFDVQEMIQYMPDMTKEFRNLMKKVNVTEESTWKYYQYADGTMKGIPRVWVGGWVPHNAVIRKDILDELGYEMPKTLDDLEEIFEAYKVAYPNNYPMTACGTLDWQSFDLVFGAFGITAMQTVERNGKVVQEYTLRETREAIEVLRRWYDKELIDPNFVTTSDSESNTMFDEGRLLVSRAWFSPNAGYDFDPKNNRTKDIPGAIAVNMPYVSAGPGYKPAAMVWNPFLGQVTGLGKHLENDRDKMHKIMQVGNLMGTDEELNFLAGYGLEGEHYELNKDGLPELIDSVMRMSGEERTDRYGFGYFWNGTFSNFMRSSSEYQRMLDEFVNPPNAMYGSNNLSYVSGVVRGPVTDLAGEPVQTATKTRWWQMVVDIMTGVQPIEYYDEWLEFYYDSGGRAWEEHATRLYGSK